LPVDTIVNLVGEFARLVDDAPADLRQRFSLGAGPVPDRNGVAGLEQALGHRIAHASHADPAECVLCHVFFSLFI